MSRTDRLACLLRARGRLLVGAAVAAAALLAPAGGHTTTNALFVDSQAVASNTASTTSLANPGPVTVSNGTPMTLTWTATPSTFAAGYRIYRSGTSGVVGPLVATVTPRTTVTWTDNAPLAGTNYYVVRAYDGTYWESGYTESSGVSVLTVSDQFNGTAGSALGNTEVGGRPWVSINGTWTRNGSGFATTATGAGSNPMAVVDVFSTNVDVRADTPNASGPAVYFRVQDGSNWLRARSRSVPYSYQYYNTEYQWTTYGTEYQYNDRRLEYEYYYTQWQVADVESVPTYHFVSYTYTWSGWYDYEGPICQSSAPSVPSNTVNTQYGVRAGTTCNNGAWTRWFKQRNDRTTNTNMRSSSCNCPLAGETLDKITYSNQVVGYYWNGGPFGGRPAPISPDYETGATQRVYGWSTTNNFGGTDNRVATGVTRYTIYGQYWATGPADGDDTATGSSRQVITSQYWSSSWCSGCATRQVGPYTASGTDYYVHAEKSVAGAITSLGSWTWRDSPTSSVRVVANGSTIQVYRNTSSLIATLTDGSFVGQTRHGIGLGGTDTTSPTNAVTNAYIGGL